MLDFVYSALPQRVVFGAGKIAEAIGELERLGVTRALVLSTPEQAADAAALAQRLGKLCCGTYAKAAMHTPVDVTENALKVIADLRADGLVALGGGSTIGLSKAIALRTDLDQLAIPTTYAGSEVTSIIGQTEGRVKTTQTTDKVLPEAVIYDPELTYSLPAFIAGPSAMNALAHAVEALYAENQNPITSMLAEASIAAIGRALPGLMADDLDREARASAFYGSWLAGNCLASVGMAIHHKICHTLGGTFDLNHAAIHCLMIPYTAAFNRDHAPAAMRAIARALDTSDPVGAVYDLMQVAASKKTLREFGLTETDLDKASDLAVQKAYFNPRPVERQDVRNMLQDAYEGKRP